MAAAATWNLREKFQRTVITSGLGFGHCFYKRYGKSCLEKNLPKHNYSLRICMWKVMWRQAQISESNKLLTEEAQKNHENLQKILKAILIRSYENGKFCSKFILSCFWFVVHVAMAPEQSVEVKGILCTALSSEREHGASPWVPAGRAAAVSCRCELASRCARQDSVNCLLLLSPPCSLYLSV